MRAAAAVSIGRLAAPIGTGHAGCATVVLADQSGRREGVYSGRRGRAHCRNLLWTVGRAVAFVFSFQRKFRPRVERCTLDLSFYSGRSGDRSVAA